jgi:lactoylglutathione lyase
MAIIHTCLNVSDVEQSVEWYVENLGFESSWGFESEDGESNRYVADENGIELQLSETDEESLAESGNRWDHLAVAVDDVDATFEAIDHHGVRQAPADQPATGSRTAFVFDPDGHVIELVESLEE